jgi:hypothetical protein
MGIGQPEYVSPAIVADCQWNQATTPTDSARPEFHSESFWVLGVLRE